MTEDLLIKEKGFHQLNEELEQKAHNLIKKIDYAINTYNNGCSVCDLNIPRSNFVKGTIEFSQNIIQQKENNSQFSVKRNSSLPHIFDQFSSLRPKVEVQKDIKDEASKNRSLANKTVITLFKAKIDILQNELKTIRVEYKKKCDICKDLELENKKLEVKSQNDLELLKETVTKLENVNKGLQCQCQTLNTENSIMKKDLDKLQKQVKVSIQQSNNYNMRLNRSLENNDKLRSALKYSQMEEKELRNQIRKLEEDKRLTVNNLGKQLSELIQMFKKQILIIDNLKKQNACLMAIGQLKFTKEDFSKLLDQKHQNL